MYFIFFLLGLSSLVDAQCPYGANPSIAKRQSYTADVSSTSFLDQFTINDDDAFFTTDAGGPIQENVSLKAGARGPTLLEDFIFRQKIQHFDHERVPERAVHARGAGAHGIFTSYGNYSNITAASFLAAEGKETPVFVRFSTVAGSRGSADTARDVHGFATRFYTDEGNFDIVGNNIPVFFIQDAILFPDLIHSVKPSPDKEIPQAATGHDSAWDFFSQQPSCLHTVFWAMAGNGIPRSFRHMDGFGVHTFRFVTDSGSSKLIKWHWKSKQGKASLVWEEAQVMSGKNADSHRQDLWDAIESGNGPEWELGVQLIEEEDVLAYGFDLLDPTKFLPEEIVPVFKLGVMKLDANPRNYFAETEQVMFQPGHIVRGVDFTDDPLLQGRIFSYLDTQLNRHSGPNFEQLPINRPLTPIHNNNRDGAGQNFIPLNVNAYTPTTLNSNPLKEATQSTGRGFFTAPFRTVSGNLVREISPTFSDYWSQPRMFYNSLSLTEQQFLVNAIRFELAHVDSAVVKQNVLIQLNRVSHDIAVRVASALDMQAPDADDTYYNTNSTAGIGTYGGLESVAGLKVGVLVSVGNASAMTQAMNLKSLFAGSEGEGVLVSVVGEKLAEGVDMTYSAADASAFDGIVIMGGMGGLLGFTGNGTDSSQSTLYPRGRPRNIIDDAYAWGKVVGGMEDSKTWLGRMGMLGEGVYTNATDLQGMMGQMVEGLKGWRVLSRFPLDA